MHYLPEHLLASQHYIAKCASHLLHLAVASCGVTQAASQCMNAAVAVAVSLCPRQPCKKHWLFKALAGGYGVNERLLT